MGLIGSSFEKSNGQIICRVCYVTRRYQVPNHACFTVYHQPFEFPRTASVRRYVISYFRANRFPTQIFLSSASTSFTVRRLQFQTEYNFTVRAEIRFSACYLNIPGVESDVVTATPVESRK